VLDLKKDVEGALEQCEDSNRYMAVYSGGDDLARRIRQQCFAKDGTPLRPHKLNDSLQRLHERLGCYSQHSIPIGFFYAKWSEKLHFQLARAHRQERSHSTASSSRTRTPSPTPASTHSPNPPDQHSKSPIIASSSAAARVMTIEKAEESLNEIREKRAAIFVDTKDGLLKKNEKAVFWYRHNRRLEWKAVASETMLSESEWNDQHDQEQLVELQKMEGQLETLLAEHVKPIGYGPTGQRSN
jgi:hypothetical protein